MQISILFAQQIAQLFLILIMGYAVVKAGLLKASDSKVLSVVMVYLVTPCVIINAFQINDTPEIRKGLLYSMAIAAAIHVVLLVLSALLSRPLKLDAVEYKSPLRISGVSSIWNALMITQGVTRYTMTTESTRLSLAFSSPALTTA